MAVGPCPGGQVDPQVRIPARHGEGGAGAQAGQGPFDQDVGAPVEPEVLKVDSRVQR